MSSGDKRQPKRAAVKKEKKEKKVKK